MPIGPLLIQRTFANGRFSISFQTVPNSRDTLEFKKALAETTWQPLTSVVGDGALKVLSDLAAVDLGRFYRMRIE